MACAQVSHATRRAYVGHRAQWLFDIPDKPSDTKAAHEVA